MNSMIKNAIILTLITLCSGLLLGLVYEVTKQPIADAQEAATQEAYKVVFADADSFEDADGFDTEAAQAILDGEGYASSSIDATVVAYSGSEALGYVFTVTNSDGYGGDITFTIGITNDGLINGISFLTLSETAGLGMKANEPDFYDQYAEKVVQLFTVTKVGSTSESEIDAISGATITSSAVTEGVNASVVYWESITGGVVSE